LYKGSSSESEDLNVYIERAYIRHLRCFHQIAKYNFSFSIDLKIISAWNLQVLRIRLLKNVDEEVKREQRKKNNNIQCEK